MKKRKVLLYCLLVLLSFFKFQTPAFAEGSASLIINEVHPNPEIGEKEWVELFNGSDNDIVLLDYKLVDAAGNIFTDLSSKTIPAKGYLVVENTNKLNNSGDTLFLEKDESPIDQVVLPDFSKLKQKSYARFPNGVDSSAFIVMAPTKGEENLKPSYSGDIIINEILPHPVDGAENEFIELYNQGEEKIDLDGWSISDLKSSKSLTGEIQPKDYFILYHIVSLNDDGDTIRLIDPNNDIKSKASYSKAIKGESFSRAGDGWSWTSSLTPRAVNIISTKILEKGAGGESNTPIEVLRSFTNGTRVEAIGIVTVLPGALSTQFFYIEDGSSGIQVYCSKKDFPLLQIGDRITVSGELSQSSGERRIKIGKASDIAVLEHISALAPTNVKINEIGENLEGRYVRISGTIQKTSGSSFVVEGDGGQVQVILKKGALIKKPKMRKGDTFEISGIVSQYKNSYRILPTKQDDVKIISSAILPRAGALEFVYFYFSIGTIFLWNISLIVKKKLMLLPKR